MFNFEDALKLIPEQTIVCVGDLMLDDFVYGEVSRISPEAPAPILAVKRNELTVGGAGNVARNIAALGARCIFLGGVRLHEKFVSSPSIIPPICCGRTGSWRKRSTPRPRKLLSIAHWRLYRARRASSCPTMPRAR